MQKVLGILLCFSGVLQSATTIDFLKERVCNILPSIEGFCTKEKAGAFIDLIIEVEPEVCVEIGVYNGASLFPVAAALKYLDKGVVLGIDPWDPEEATKGFHPIRDKQEYHWIRGVDYDQIFSSFESLMSRYKLKDFCITIRSSAHLACRCIPSIDILHIDGNLSEVASVQDVEDYLPLVRPGGYIWISDADKYRKQKALEFLHSECDRIKAIDGGKCLLFKKRELL